MNKLSKAHQDIVNNIEKSKLKYIRIYFQEYQKFIENKMDLSLDQKIILSDIYIDFLKELRRKNVK